MQSISLAEGDLHIIWNKLTLLEEILNKNEQSTIESLDIGKINSAQITPIAIDIDMKAAAITTHNLVQKVQSLRSVNISAPSTHSAMNNTTNNTTSLAGLGAGKYAEGSGRPIVCRPNTGDVSCGIAVTRSLVGLGLVPATNLSSIEFNISSKIPAVQ